MPADLQHWVTLYEIAVAAAQTDNVLEAEKYFVRALRNAKFTGQTAEVLGDICEQITIFYFNQRNLRKAAQFCKGAIDYYTVCFGLESPKVANSLNTLAGIYYRQQRYDQSEVLCTAAMAVFSKTLGRQHPNLAIASNNMALVCHARKRYQKAAQYYKQCLDISQELISAGDPCLVLLQDNYERLLRDIQLSDQLDTTIAEEIHPVTVEAIRSAVNAASPALSPRLNFKR